MNTNTTFIFLSSLILMNCSSNRSRNTISQSKIPSGLVYYSNEELKNRINTWGVKDREIKLKMLPVGGRIICTNCFIFDYPAIISVRLRNKEIKICDNTDVNTIKNKRLTPNLNGIGFVPTENSFDIYNNVCDINTRIDTTIQIDFLDENNVIHATHYIIPKK